jgi:acyl-coenzyme A synthetase/AMP-(fatty) acid ligase
MSALPGAQFGNIYGPAEVNQCMFAGISSAPSGTASAVPIGEFWPEAEGLVVDEHDHPVPPGESGELLVASDTMMRDYWGQPELTDTSTVMRGSGTDRKRFYRTGDRVRQDTEGVFWFVGRRDRQTKIRGQRVELDEVESALIGHDDVHSSAVFTVQDRNGDVRIEAAVLAANRRTPSERELRAFLLRSMPPAAVPEHIAISHELPLTGTGKIDRRSLAQERQRQLDGDRQADPRGGQ